MKRCPGYPLGSCLTNISKNRLLCSFCHGTFRAENRGFTTDGRAGKVDGMEKQLIPEAKVGMVLTRERQFCTLCWSFGKRTQVISVALRANRTQQAYRQLRRRRISAHIRSEHPDSWAMRLVGR